MKKPYSYLDTFLLGRWSAACPTTLTLCQEGLDGYGFTPSLTIPHIEPSRNEVRQVRSGIFGHPTLNLLTLGHGVEGCPAIHSTRNISWVRHALFTLYLTLSHLLYQTLKYCLPSLWSHCLSQESKPESNKCAMHSLPYYPLPYEFLWECHELLVRLSRYD